MTDCVARFALSFHPLRDVAVAFDAPQISSDGGLLLVRQLDEQLGLTATLAGSVPDERQTAKVSHSRQEQVRQRVYQIAAGYEDCNDADSLRHDPLFKTVCDRLPQDAGLSSQPTLSRFENAVRPRWVASLLRDFEQQWLDQLQPGRKRVVLDIDATDDPTHGAQQLTFFHGFYDQYMYHPLLVYDAEDGALVTMLLRPGNTHSARGAMGVLTRLVRKIRARCPRAHIVVRADSGFAVPRVMQRLEQLAGQLGGLDYALGLARNPVLQRRAERWAKQAARRFDRTGKPVRLFGEFRYAAETWPRRRRVVVKAEHLPKGANPRFVVTSLQRRSPQSVYALYCKRGQMENLIKDLKNALHGDRLSCTRFAANWLRLLLHGTAYRLLHALRQRLVEHSAELGRLQLDTLRLRLIKVAALVTQSVRRILVRLPSAYPWAGSYAALAALLDPAPT